MKFLNIFSFFSSQILRGYSRTQKIFNTISKMRTTVTVNTYDITGLTSLLVI